MQYKKLHIIFSLVAVFLFPILYQPLHIIEHQTNQSVEVQCELDHANTNNSSNVKLQQQQDDCLVCSYELAIQSFVKLTQYSTPSTQLIDRIAEKECSSSLVSVDFKYITRPPPTV